MSVYCQQSAGADHLQLSGRGKVLYRVVKRALKAWALLVVKCRINWRKGRIRLERAT